MSWIDTLAYRISGRQRARKFQQFLDLVGPKPDETILDVGVNDEEYSDGDNYLEKHYPRPDRITAVSRESLDHFAARYPDVRSTIADGTRLPFIDDEFAIAYSNAVIEHVGDHESQVKFLRELARVSRRGYLTTPNRRFPVEVHTRIPLLHLFLPKPWFDALLRRIGKDWAAGDYMHLLSRKDLDSIFRSAGITDYRVISNRFLGLTMTFTVVWKK